MKVLGLVTEYNPFHNGHLYHLELSKKICGADYTVCVMSGNFIQRGQPALLDKWARTGMALSNGIDLVIELPVSYVLQSAEHFAFGAVEILDSLGLVDYLSFGSECGEVDILNEIAVLLCNEPMEFSSHLKKLLQQGYSYAQAREQSVLEYLGKSISENTLRKVMSSPNNILGIEYLKALHRLQSNIRPLTVKRHKTGYHSLEYTDPDGIASATAIRSIIQKSLDWDRLRPLLPAASLEVIRTEAACGKAPVFMDYFETAIVTLLRKLNSDQLSNYPDVNEGLENRIVKAAMENSTLDHIFSAIKTKRYTHTRLSRIMCNILLGITRDQFSSFQKSGGPQYIRVLGANHRGTEILKAAKSRATLPLIIKPSSYDKSCNPILKQMIELDFLATDLFSLGYPEPEKRKGRLDLTTSPLML